MAHDDAFAWRHCGQVVPMREQKILSLKLGEKLETGIFGDLLQFLIVISEDEL